MGPTTKESGFGSSPFAIRLIKERVVSVPLLLVLGVKAVPVGKGTQSTPQFTSCHMQMGRPSSSAKVQEQHKLHAQDCRGIHRP